MSAAVRRRGSKGAHHRLVQIGRVRTMRKVMLRTWLALAVAVALGGATAAQGQPKTTITYWQYYFESKVKLLDALIPQFERQNPGIHVVQETFPYDSYNQKVASAVPAGQ